MVARSPRLCKMLAISHLFSQAVYPFDVFQDCWGDKIEKDLRRTLHK